jgi:hypothetical protein
MQTENGPGDDWLGRLIEAATPEEVSALIEILVESQHGSAQADVYWLHPRSRPDRFPDDPAIASFCKAALAAPDGRRASSDGHQLALSLSVNEQMVLVVESTDETSARTILASVDAYMQLATRQLGHALKLAKLYASHSQLEHSENLQRALFAISDLAGSNLDMPEMLREIHRIVGSLMYAENFFIVRYYPERETLRFLYYADINDEDRPDTRHEMHLEDRRNTLTWYLLTRGKPLFGSNEQLLEQIEYGPLRIAGPDSEDWLGVPMMHNGVVHGALVVQSYGNHKLYTR